MKFRHLFDETESDGTRAVSPVIGVILMVAITVILAAVIGTFVLGLGESVDSAPQASLDFQVDDSGSPKAIDVSHRGGDRLVVDEIEFRIDGTTVNLDSTPDEIRVGDTVSVDVTTLSPGGATDANGQTLDVIYTSGDRDSIIASFDIPAGAFS